ncbi:fatty acid desaturase [Lichenihabitans sp. Uapishka_5]|uniref:fatty acid desaturase n=1 Tax=Lichenihabitans sp. Uapishka_5 TaxID=3037302 RepID=UPI0029E7EE8E|nr:fatty acid desaturase [Lichenihabitans sp. Uapishka_5]MDX7950189.1 fatty acid desaturase [Lichenihabitans sp. Uapishka_5]
MTRHRTKSLEWPSIALCALLYGGFVGLTWWSASLPAGVIIPALALLIAWHSSLQHEFIHGHPTPWRKVNRALGNVPLALWLPFESYRISHLLHHRDDSLTDPLDDPESYYWTPAQWQALGPVGRLWVHVHSTLAGRLLLGPLWNVSRYIGSEVRAMRGGDRLRRRIWRSHAVASLALSIWLFGLCHVNPFAYVAAVYGGTSILLLRSFAEHRAQDAVHERTAIVENAWFFGPLFLFNNLHAAHHERPCMPWYELPRWYRENRSRLVAENGGLVYDGYGAVARRFLLRPHHQLLHPSAASPIGASRPSDGLGLAP